VCSNDAVFGPALRRSLERYEVVLSGVPTDLDEPLPDLVVWHQGETSVDQSLASIAARVPVVVVANSDQMTSVVEFGGRGFVTPDATLEEIVTAVEAVFAGGAFVSPRLLGSLLRSLVDRKRESEDGIVKLDDLTPREADVFDLASRGIRREEIAAALFISPDTARTHLQRVYRKLGVHTQAELVAFAARTGRLRLEEAP
jgi:DNA-binding NarL/FixJ family response regulator